MTTWFGEIRWKTCIPCDNVEKAEGTGKCTRCRDLDKPKEFFDENTGECVDCASCEYLSVVEEDTQPQYYDDHFLSYVKNVGECKPLARRSLVLDGNTLTITGVDQYAKDITHTNHKFLKREPADLEAQYAIQVSSTAHGTVCSVFRVKLPLCYL